jgi:benzylsuccinate CoA-transferase BbsF subunit
MKPLDEVRVVDFGWVWAGAVCGQILAAMGAEVIKIESRRRLDGLRLGRVFETGTALERNPTFHNINRGKLSFTVDISAPEGRDIVRALVAKSDVVIENFTPGVLERLGLGYAELAAVQPRLVMLSMSGAGQTGPLRDIMAYAPIIHSLSGFDSLIGYGPGDVIGTKLAYLDVSASIHGALAVLAALRHAQETGQGQHIDLSEWEVAVSLLGEAIVGFQLTGTEPQPAGNRLPGMAPCGIYPCRGEDAWISIAVADDAEWQGLCRALGRLDWLSDPGLADGFGRWRRQSDLDAGVAAWTRERAPMEAAEVLQAEGVPAAPCFHIGELLYEPHFEERDLFAVVEHPVTGTERVYNMPWHFSAFTPQLSRHAPLLGQDNDYVLYDVLGLSEEEVRTLRDKGVLQ